jgi:uncharacterized protein involved in exopolysaccharide biosynthesis
MQQQNDTNSSEQQFENPIGGTLSEYIYVVNKHGKLIGYITIATFILSIIVSLLLPKTYVATARVLPPRDNSSGLASLFSSADNPLSHFTEGLSDNQTSAALYVGILKSRSVADGLNQKFKLKEYYKLNYIEDVYAILAAKSTIQISKKDKLVSVSVKDSDPQRAADMANAYLDLLDKINRKLNITQGKRKRLFLEDRLKQVREGLEQAETVLKEFQEKNNIVSIQEQAIAAIKGAAEIKGQLIAAQTELEVFRKFGTEKQIEAVMLKAKIDGLKKQLDSIEKGKKITQLDSNPAATDHESDIFIPFDDLPHLGTQLMRLTRDAKIQAKLFELLNSQYEMARIEEARDINSLQILDLAVPPEKKSGPRRRAIVVASVLIALLFSVLLAFFLENIGRFRNISR